MFDALFGKKDVGSEPPASVLAEWNKYSGETTKDVETGQTSKPTVTGYAEQAGQNVKGFLTSSFKQVSSGVSAVQNSVSQTSTSVMPSGNQMVQFGFLFGGGLLFLMLAFSLGLPMLAITPSKFAISFSLGCLCLMLAFCALRGWKSSWDHMMTRERLPFTAGYIASIIGTLYAAMIMHSYLLSLLCSGVQVLALMYYIMSYFPGGVQGASFVLKMLYQGLVNCLSGVKTMVFRGQ
eukprot:TRINITY_DN1368_c0_g1_i1.p1 TRINITY_DN1368_c0_g1~~TRINITY_DN1368_c0_g1_i1.p1  ORF type:complete len:263 (-),score=3.72 TRINITY_DN1368_c0_g1_i1:48-755(-)